MSDKKQIKDLQQKMQSLRTEREKRFPKEQTAESGSVSNAMSAITTIVQAFVKEDRSLMVQSSDDRNIFISYGFHAICRLSISGSESTSITVQLETDTVKETLFNGKPVKKDLQIVVQNALLKWYQSIS